MADVKHTPDIPDGVSGIAKKALSVLGKAFPATPNGMFRNADEVVPTHLTTQTTVTQCLKQSS